MRRDLSCNEASYDVALRQRAGSRPMTLTPFINPRAKVQPPFRTCNTPTHCSTILVLSPLSPLSSSYIQTLFLVYAIPFKVPISFLLSPPSVPLTNFLSPPPAGTSIFSSPVPSPSSSHFRSIPIPPRSTNKRFIKCRCTQHIFTSHTTACSPA